MILGGAFSLNDGPVAMFKKNSPYLAKLVEENLTTGAEFEPPEGWTPR